MIKDKNIKYITLTQLQLDYKSPRLPIDSSNENDIIEWMLQGASILELMLSIGENGFFIGESLLIVKETNQYIVIEGNRRLTALKILNNPELATLHKRKIKQVLDETTYRPKDIPCILFEKREEILKYLGYKHITGVKSWSIFSKAKYLYESKDNNKNITYQSRELAKKIGSRSDYVKRLIIGYEVYNIIKNEKFYNIDKLNKDTLHFNYISDFLRYENINNFINVDLDSENPLVNLNKQNLQILIQLFFERNRNDFYVNTENLSKLNKIFLNTIVSQKFLNGLSLEDTCRLIDIEEE